MVGLAQESRERIDALLGRKTTSRLEFDDSNVANALSDSRRTSTSSTSSRQSDYDKTDVRRTSRDDVLEQRTIAVKNDGNGGNVSINLTASSVSSENPKPSPLPPKVKPKPPKPSSTRTSTTVEASPKLMKKPFKFGMVSLQVKLDD